MKSKEQSGVHLEKARRALNGAHLLLREGDSEGACNRAYYAMFHAAHAFLLARTDVPVADIRTHAGLVAAFGRHAVLEAKLDAELGRRLNQVQRLRQLADYTGDAPPAAEATWAVEVAATFVTAITGSIP